MDQEKVDKTIEEYTTNNIRQRADINTAQTQQLEKIIKLEEQVEDDRQTIRNLQTAFAQMDKSSNGGNNISSAKASQIETML